MCAAVTCFQSLSMQNHFYSCSAWSLNAKENHRLTACENKALRSLFKSQTEKETKTDSKKEDGENCIMRSFIINTFHQILLQSEIKDTEMDGTHSAHGRDQKSIKMSITKPEGKDQL